MEDLMEDLMSLPAGHRFNRSRSRWIAFVTLIGFTTILSVNLPARAEDSAAQILKSMSDYVSSQQSISLTFNSDIEVITPEIQKIQFASSGKLVLQRPDKLRANRTGGYTDVEIVFDGNTVTVLGKNIKAYAQSEVSGDVDKLVDVLRDQYSLEFPGADLLLSNPYKVLMADVLEAKHIGQGVVDGVQCEHLAFRNQDTDWQLWVEVGDHPIPRKFVITSKATAAAPQYTLLIKDWKTDAEIGADAFAFQPPAEAKKVELKALRNIDEVPPGVIKGETE
jgi:hypothetical protein